MWDSIYAILRNIFSNTVLTKEDLINILFSFLLAIIIGIIISQIYRVTNTGMNYEQSFMIALVLLGPIVTAVMLFIQGNLVLSLGLVGSLSIIRFRTPIKDTRDMIFLFWVIAAGLGCGTYNWTIAVIFSLILLIVIIVMQIMKYGQSNNRDFVLIISGNQSYPSDEIDSVIKKYTSDAQIRSHESEDDHWETIFEIRFSDLKGKESKALIQDLKDLAPVAKISLLAPQIALPV